MTDHIEEEKAAHTADGYEKDVSGKGAVTAKPTGKAAAKQGKADANKSVDPKADSVQKAKGPGQGMAEAVAEIFAGQDLSEDFMDKASTIFEAAINERVADATQALEEAYEQKLEEELEGAVNELVEKIDEYLDYAVSHYMEENAIAIERGIQVEMAESFMTGLKGLFEEHNVSIDDESLDVVAEMAEDLEALEAKLNEQIEENISLKTKLQEAAAADVFATVAEGLTMSEVEKLSVLSEGFDFGDLDAYSRKLEVVKENYFGSKKVVVKESLDDEPLNIAEETYVDAGIAAVAAAISKSVKR